MGILAEIDKWCISTIEKLTVRQVKCLRTNNELDFCYDEFNTLYKKEGIVRHHTVHHTPQ